MPTMLDVSSFFAGIPAWLNPSLTYEILIVFLVVAVTLVLFITERLPVDITSFLVMVTLILLGLVFPDSFPSIKQGLSGLSNPATITVLAMFILSAGIQRTGIIHALGKKVFSFVGNSEFRQILAIGLIVAPISGFINNTAAVAIILPMILDLSKRSGIAATKLLIPLSFFGMLGGTLTLIGTSTNILASSILIDSNVLENEIGMFEFTKLGLIVLAVGTVYLLTIGRFLLPDRKEVTSAENILMAEDNNIYLTEVVVRKNFAGIGKTLAEHKFTDRTDIKVLKLIRAGQSYIKDVDHKTLEEGDILVLSGNEQHILNLKTKKGMNIIPNFDETQRKYSIKNTKIVKVLLKNAKLFEKKTIAQFGFWEKFSIKIVGIHRGDLTTKKLEDTELKGGDVMLVQGSLANLQKLKEGDDFLLLDTVENEFQPEKIWITLAIIAAVTLSSAFMGVPIVASALVGVMAMVLTKCIEAKGLYDLVNWKVIFLLTGMIPLGIAMQKSGAGDFLAGGIVSIAGDISPFILLMMIYLITTLLTEIISNNAAVVLLIPIVISVTYSLGLNPFAFSLAVMFAASTSFLSPVGYQTNTMVYASANYKFSDFIKVGAPLNMILLFVTCYFIDMWWPLSLA